jgi:hypothetical protein
MQGALFALSALANAIGPLLLEVIYDHTKDGQGLGPGTMFVFASLLYFVGTIIVSVISRDKANGSSPIVSDDNELEEPLLRE